MMDCRGGKKAVKEDKAARSKRLHALYLKKQGQTCAQAKGDDVEVDDSKVFNGSPHACMEKCLSGKGAKRCHGFTYSKAQGRCSFNKDSLSGKANKDPESSCYYKKAIPLLRMNWVRKKKSL